MVVNKIVLCTTIHVGVKSAEFESFLFVLSSSEVILVLQLLSLIHFYLLYVTSLFYCTMLSKAPRYTGVRFSECASSRYQAHFPDEVRPGIEAMVTIMSIDIGQTECLLCTVYWSCVLFLDHTQLWFAELYANNIAMFSTQIGHVHHLRSKI